MPYEYHGTIKEITDGDTLVVDIDLGFNIILFDQKVRLIGVDTPESRTTNKIEKQFGLASKEFVKQFVSECLNKEVIIRTHISEKTDANGKEKFGRLLAEIINPKSNKNLNEELINNNFAVRYMGENKNNVKEQHIKNRKILIDKKIVNVSYKDAEIIS
jgi:micrococcal nuclease